MTATMVPDWAQIINELATAGHSSREISCAMQTQITNRMIRWYSDGMQPAWWRGDLLIGYWCSVMRRERSDVPMTELQRGYRAHGSYDTGPRLQELPKWPVAVPVAVAPIKRRKREAA